MRLSAMDADQLAKTLCDLTPPLCRILRDDQTQAALEAVLTPEMRRQPMLKAVSAILKELVPQLLKRHWEDVCCVVAVLEGKPVQEVRHQRGEKLLNVLQAYWEEDLIAFFQLCRRFTQECILCAVSGMERVTSVAALAAVLEAQQRQEQRMGYQAQLLWQVATQLCALRDMEQSMPDYEHAFPSLKERVRPRQVMRRLLEQLEVDT